VDLRYVCKLKCSMAGVYICYFEQLEFASIPLYLANRYILDVFITCSITFTFCFHL
jgi:hypothetical protein